MYGFSWLGRFLSELLSAGGVNVAVSVLFILLFLGASAWLIRFRLQLGQKIRIAKMELDREKINNEQRHIQNLENEAKESRTFLSNHMSHFLERMDKITEAIQESTSSNNRMAAKQIESLSIVHEKMGGLERDHATMQSRIDDVWKGSR